MFMHQFACLEYFCEIHSFRGVLIILTAQLAATILEAQDP